MDRPNVVFVSINEQNEMSSQKSLSIDLKLISTNSFVSPVIDLDRRSKERLEILLIILIVQVMFFQLQILHQQNQMVINIYLIYITKKELLKILYIFKSYLYLQNKVPTSDIKVLHKVW